jgi:TatD DNase family protein
MIIDAHAHLTGQEDPELKALLDRAKAAGVKAIVNVSCDEHDLERGLLLAKSSQNPKVVTISAITPHDAAKEMSHFFERIEEAASKKLLAAIGETGLDYFYMHAPKEEQLQALSKHFHLACEHHLPLVIHCREAFFDLFTFLDVEIKKRGMCPKIMIHCFTGTVEEAKEVIARGWYLSLSGCVTYPKNRALQEVACLCPLELLLVETDSPFLAPTPYRGKKNEPAYLRETVKHIASCREISEELLALKTTQNAESLFFL